MEIKTKGQILKRLGIWSLIIGCILLIPFFASFPWTVSDFIFAFGLLFVASVVCEILSSHTQKRRARIIIGIIVLGLLSVIWIYAATGFEGVSSHPLINYLINNLGV